MSLLDRARLLLGEFAQEFGLPDPPLDEDGRCGIVVDESVFLHLEVKEEDGHVVLYSVVGEADEDAPEALLERLLAANLGWLGTDGGTLGVDDLTDDIVLRHTLDIADMPYPVFRGLVERLINSAEEWVEALAPAAEPPAVATLPPFFPSSFA